MNTFLLNCCAGAAKIIKCGCNATAATNETDLEITKAICWAIVCVTGCLVVSFLIWKLIDHIANAVSGWNKRQWEVEDKGRKQQADLLEKKLQILYELCKKDKAGEFKEHDSGEVNKYLDALQEALKIKHNPQGEKPMQN